MHKFQRQDRFPKAPVEGRLNISPIGCRKQLGQTVTPVSVPNRSRMDAAPSVEKDGTGIGAGFDRDMRPVLGVLHGLAQDVTVEHGRSGPLGALNDVDCGPHGRSIH